MRISLTVSAKLSRIEVSWFHVRPLEGAILLTNEEARGPFRKYVATEPFDEQAEYGKHDTTSGSSENISGSNGFASSTTRPTHSGGHVSIKADNDSGLTIESTHWTYDSQNNSALFWIKPDEESGWETTGITFNYDHLKNLTVDTGCYGYWATYVNDFGERLASACISAYPKWMNGMRDNIKHHRFRDLFIPGSHDSGSFRSNFNPLANETLVTKYSLTQVSLPRSVQEKETFSKSILAERGHHEPADARRTLSGHSGWLLPRQ